MREEAFYFERPIEGMSGRNTLVPEKFSEF